MPESDTELAKRFQASRPQALRSDCPPAERLWAAVAGQLSLDELRQTTSHSAECTECSDALRIALELRRASAASAELGAVVPLHARPRRWLAVSGASLLAAGVAAALLVRGLESRTNPKSPLETTRDTERGGDVSHLALPQGGLPSSGRLGTSVSPDVGQSISSETAPGPQRRNAVHLRWTAYPHAVRYNVSVMTPSFQLLHRAIGVLTTELRVPPEVLARQPTGTRLFWTVEATMPDGQIVESGLFPLELE